jgi:large subunit ribosomal protein L7/L12
MPTVEEVVESLGNMSVMQLIELTKHLEDRWGINAAPIPLPGVEMRAATAYGGPPVPEEQTEWAVILESAPADKKMATIKAVREIMGLGLKDAKEGVEHGKLTVKENVSRAEADEIRSKLVEAGAEVWLK